MIVQGTSVGLDVHALSVVAHAVDEVTGQVSRARLCPDHGEILGWLRQLRATVRVAYEAGPTGFGLARALSDAGMDCVVVDFPTIAETCRWEGTPQPVPANGRRTWATPLLPCIRGRM